MFRTTKVCKGIVLAFGGSLALMQLPALAQQQLEKVEITGSSIKRIDAESAVPVQVLTRDDIQRTGATTVEQLLQTVSAVTSSGGLTASSVSGATTGGISSISLRGLNSTRTLVLLNGRRIAPYGIGFTGDSVSVDVNSIPLAAVERVEVLKDGASAIYGSDAVAGVVNFILRKDFTGTEISGTYGDTSGGGASVVRGSATLGFGDLSKDRYNVMLVASWQKEKPLFGRDRPFSRVGFNSLNDTTSGNTFPANIAAADGSFGSRNPSNPACPAPYTVYDPQLSTKACRFDPAPLVQLTPTAERTSLFSQARFAITPDIEAYLEASLNHNSQNNVIQPVPISDQFALPPSHPLYNVAPYNGFSTILLKPTSPFYPTAYVQGLTGGATPDLLVRWRAAAAGNRDLTDISDAPRLAFGVKGTTFGWDWDGGYLHSLSHVVEQVNNGFPSLSKILPLLNSGTVNFFGPNTPAIDAAIQATNFRGNAFEIKSSLDSFQFKGSREVAQLPAGAVAVAVGSEYRKETYKFNADPTIQTGDISGYGGNFLSVDRSRKVGALFGEINVPVFKGFELDGAVRYDKYGGVGSSTTPKLGMRFQPVKEVLVRGSIGKGFRAPSLQDLYAPNTTGVTPPGLNDPLADCSASNPSKDVRDCATQFPILNGGNANLKPEKSTNTTLGIVFEPTSSTSIAVDYFKIHLTNTIGNGVPAAVILGDLAKYGYLVTRGAPDASNPNGHIINIDQTNLNFGQTKLAGFDFDGKFRFSAGEVGKVTVNYSGTYFTKYDTENLDGTFSPNINLVNSNTGGLIPRLKTYLSVTLARGPWSYTLAQSWQNSYEDLPGTLEDTSDPAWKPRRVGAYELYDAQVQYTGVKNLSMTVGMKNIFNRPPPYSNAGGQTSFQTGYDPQYGDPRGRFVYATLTYTFK
ncbi:TonB-dependent receptor [Piscinibacter terrae]|uniref:TonB-dependent receptor n=1 Tax=Piscinibacter terrae TaxID=2496871 RepID=A0A3N7JR07_9BURK|nr:TonB-dependent receptor [Albitalea terrae]RQP23449.1 TonB-dependent receptor [Albitalea terrae]